MRVIVGSRSLAAARAGSSIARSARSSALGSIAPPSRRVAPELAARVAFTAIGELTVRAMLEDPASPMIDELRSMAAAYLRA